MKFPHLESRAGKLADSLDLPANLAQWLTVTALHSGCFLRPQLKFFGGYDGENRKSLTRIIRKLLSMKLITETPVDSLGLLTRVTNKAVYRLIGADNIRHRRLASWPLMYRRLLSLDYVLDHPLLPWLPTENEKVSCFVQLGIERSNLPCRVWDNATGHTVRLFANKHPIAVDPDRKQAHFVYTDSDEKSPHGVRSWRTEHTPLWTDLHRLDYSLHIVHASFNTRLEGSVSRVFSSWMNQPHSTISRVEIETELSRVQQAIQSDDETVLQVYGGFNGALRASAALKDRLEKHSSYQPYTATYSTWHSERIAQAISNPNRFGSHPSHV